jgi:hypothetical protein
VFGILVVDDEFVESDTFKPRESDLEVSTDLTDVFRAREAACQQSKAHPHLGWIMHDES